MIVELSGKKAEFFRPPFISINDTVYNTIKVPFVCGKACMDWDPNYGEEYRYQEIIKGAENGTIYLLHVMEGNDATLKAVDRAIPVLKEQGYTIISIEQAVDSIKLNNVKDELLEGGNGKYALIFGNEVKGVQQEVVDMSDNVIEIPQFGTKHSLNISVSLGVVLWEFCKFFKL